MKRLILLVLLISSLAQGQESIRLDFRILSLEEGLNDIALVGAEGLIDLQVPSFERSDMITYQGSPLLRFIKKVAYSPDAPLPKSIFEVNLPANVTNPLLVIAAAPEGHQFQYQAMVLPDDLQNLPGGSSYFINASPYPIAVLFDTEEEPVRLRSLAVHKRAFDEGVHNVHVRIASYADGEIRKGLNSRIYPMSVHRDIYFICPRKGASSGRLTLRRLREHAKSAEEHFRRAAGEE